MNIMTEDRIMHGVVGLAFWMGYLYVGKLLKLPRRSIIERAGMVLAVLFGTWVSDWDLFLGIGYHRSPLTHSILPFLIFTPIFRPISRYVFPIGFGLGLASHLFWDIIFYGNVHWISGRMEDRLFLGVNMAILFFLIARTERKIEPAAEPTPASQGFTLIETLVAMMILSIAIVTIFQLFSGSLRAGKLSDNYSRAVFHAKEKMEEILISEKMAEGDFQGRFDDEFQWKAEIRRSDTLKDSSPPLNTFAIRVDVRWREAESLKSVSVSTLKIAEELRRDK